MKLILNMILMLILIQGCGQTQNKTTSKMKVAVWDTYVTKKDGTTMHFDILVPEEMKDAAKIYNYGKEYLKTKDQADQPLSSEECNYCHMESVRPQWETDLNKQGYFIIEMENCH